MHSTADLTIEIERALELFPELKPRLDVAGGALFPGAFARVHFHIPPDKNTVTVPASCRLE